MKNQTPVLLAAAFLALMACEGPTGPVGPVGPQGETGVVARFTANGTIGNDGRASASFPAAAGSLAELPGLTCYMRGEDPGDYWVIGTDFGGPICGLRESGGTIQAFIINAPATVHGSAVRFVLFR
jgi:hypothetical protein